MLPYYPSSTSRGSPRPRTPERPVPQRFLRRPSLLHAEEVGGSDPPAPPKSCSLISRFQMRSTSLGRKRRTGGTAVQVDVGEVPRRMIVPQRRILLDR